VKRQARITGVLFFMAEIVRTLTQAISKLNSLYNGSSTPPAAGEEDYIVWTDLLNIGISLWENEEGVLWKELFTDLTSAADGGKTTIADTYSYALPSNFKFPVSSFVWFGVNYNKTPTRIIAPSKLQLYENNTDGFAYFLNGYIKFNPNMSIHAGDPIVYNYYKKATALTTGSDQFEMSDPMFAVYYALSELKKEEGDVSALQIATQKLEAMKTLNSMGAEYQEDSTISPLGDGMGY